MPDIKKLSYPPAHKEDVVENYHGNLVSDPYRWLEDPDSAETSAWVEAQNQLTRRFLDDIPTRQTIKKRLTKLWDYPKYFVPRRRGERYFFYKNDGLQNQAVLYRQAALNGETAVVLDPNQLSEAGTVAITSDAFSEDGTHLAYGISHSGSDRQEIRVRNVDGGRDYDEVLQWCRFSSIAWKHDGTGFFYNRYPNPEQSPGMESQVNNRLYWHRLNTPQAEDVLVYQRPDAPDLNFPPLITDDGRFVVLTVWHASIPKNRLYYRRVADDGDFVRLIDEPDAQYDFVGNTGSTFYVHTDLEAPNGRIVAIDLEQPHRSQWQELIPEGDDVIDFVIMAADQFVVVTLHDAYHQIKLYHVDGSLAGEVDLPIMGTVVDISGRHQDKEFFFSFESFLQPKTVFRYDFETDALAPLWEPTFDFDAGQYETRQIFYQSKDGTQIPMFLTHRKGLSLDGNNPTLLYGYGGFDNSLTPAFTADKLLWLENGGVYAAANLRGGGEYGEVWHEAGMLDKKQNVFDDFIAAAEWLVANDYTQPSKLAIKGRSNGGLLVAACMLQRPHLFGAVSCNVPVTDMLRYHKFTAGRYWVAEYGDAENNPDHFQFLFAYSPLHNVRDGVTYPPTLITTADTDDRVVPMHAKKFAATLQATDPANPILIRIETEAGHGLGKPTSKVIDELSDIYAFLWHMLGTASDR